MKTTIAILTLALFSCGHQDKTMNPTSSTDEIDEPSFYLGYTTVGLGPNMGRKEPTIRIKGTQLIYTYEQNSSWTGEISKDDTDTILVGTFRLTSIDSIRNILHNLSDTTIYQTNPCITDGAIHFLTIAFGQDTTRFELHNTFDYTALKVTDILNFYLPGYRKLWIDETLIKKEQKCWSLLRESNKKE